MSPQDLFGRLPALLCSGLVGALAAWRTAGLQHTEVDPKSQLREGSLCFRGGLCNGSVFTAATLKPFWEQKQTSLFQETEPQELTQRLRSLFPALRMSYLRLFHEE